MRGLTTTIAFAVLFSVLSTGRVQAQHADFVLFGDPAAGASEQAPESKFVHPLTSPYFHEDSFITSDVRAWYIYHDLPASGALGGSDVTIAAAQLRLALTDKLQLVAYKDGYANFDTAGLSADGFMDIAAGLKYSFIQDWEGQFHVAGGVGYEFKTGHGDVLQNNDEFRIWASVNKGIDKLHLGATVNVFLPTGDDAPLGESQHMSWHLHADYYVCEWFSPVVELNGYHIIDEGTVALPFQGIDVTNLGGNQSEDSVTLGLGGEFRFAPNLAARVAYETPLDNSTSLFGYRWTFSVVYDF